ncbi:MAG: hypothetical protein COV96_00650 [Candidatus Zambryskibacteria bacterium CG11_big_fil_rev_8_21_14_0_20_42_18]|nr:MAG: hypothetical protein COV96_00650 [Candidatus Zambryskibacteria bacterium CG11_big_fil_rev_8_21_14_0_20_42_18]
MEKALKILSISSDRKIFEAGSAVSERMKEYGALVGELHIVVLSKKSLGLKDKQVADNVWAYPTNSSTRWLYVRDASSLGKRIVLDRKFVRGESLITTQDPFECGLAGLKVKKKWRLPLEVQLHTDPFSPYFNGALNTIRKFISRKVLKHADGVRVVTQSLKSKISVLTHAEVNVLPIYIDKQKIQDTQATFDLHARYSWRFIMLAVARLEPEKNLSLAINTLALVKKRFPDTGLVIVGSGSEEKRLKLKAIGLKLEANVAFVGWQNDVASFYKTANVFIQTSVFEGYGIALIEAGLYGLPVITTPVGIASELEHGKDAYILSPKDVEMFAGAVIDLIENNYKRESLRVNMKNTLATKLISKDDYMAQIKAGWERVSKKV